MDITQLLITVGSLAGIALVGVMAVVPAVMEAGASTADPRPAPPSTAVPPRPARRRRHLGRPADLAA